jgi:nicotinamide riboside kinase
MKICFTGTMSIGKSTLVKALSKIPEFKDYKIAVERSKYLRDFGIELNTDSTLIGQTIFASERTSELRNENILTDRSIIDVMAFTTLAKSINSVDKEAFNEFYCRFISEYDYIFYISPEGIDIEDNGVRETDPEYRNLVDFSITNLISQYKHKIKNFHKVSGSTDERIKQVLEIVFP